MQFTALVDFWSDETRSQYCAGLSYTAHDDEAHAKLRELVPQWIAEGKIARGGPLVAVVTGRG